MRLFRISRAGRTFASHTGNQPTSVMRRTMSPVIEHDARALPRAQATLFETMSNQQNASNKLPSIQTMNIAETARQHFQDSGLLAKLTADCCALPEMSSSVIEELAAGFLIVQINAIDRLMTLNLVEEIKLRTDVKQNAVPLTLADFQHQMKELVCLMQAAQPFMQQMWEHNGELDAVDEMIRQKVSALSTSFHIFAPALSILADSLNVVLDVSAHEGYRLITHIKQYGLGDDVTHLVSDMLVNQLTTLQHWMQFAYEYRDVLPRHASELRELYAESAPQPSHAR